jgi:16S rRNA (uracil1498-N3)-methyltransferase
MIEKAVELGATDFHPILSQNTEVRDINIGRITHQLTEASEQCERLDVPVLHPIQKLDHLLGLLPLEYPVYACIERMETSPLLGVFSGQNEMGFLIGPEGGFTSDEKNLLISRTHSLSLGADILRSETAALLMLSLVKSADLA